MPCVVAVGRDISVARVWKTLVVRVGSLLAAYCVGEDSEPHCAVYSLGPCGGKVGGLHAPDIDQWHQMSFYEGFDVSDLGWIGSRHARETATVIVDHLAAQLGPDATCFAADFNPDGSFAAWKLGKATDVVGQSIGKGNLNLEVWEELVVQGNEPCWQWMDCRSEDAACLECSMRVAPEA